jgi:CheY-like chemotaxis protein
MPIGMDGRLSSAFACVHTHPPEVSLPSSGGCGVGQALRPNRFLAFPTQRRIEMTMIDNVTRSVLVVDDDPEFRKLAGRLLAASGLSVVGEAAGVASALAAAAQLQPSAALVDIELPDGDGVTLACQLAAMPWHPRIVLTSINGDITSDQEARSVGARAFVNKADLPNAPLAYLLGGE